MNSDWTRGMEELGGVQQRKKKHNQYILYVGKYIFNKKKTKRANVSVTRLFTHLPLAS